MSNPIKLSELEAKANEATPGHLSNRFWTKISIAAVGGEDGSAYGWIQIHNKNNKIIRENEYTRPFICAANPIAISRLCEALRLSHEGLKMFDGFINKNWNLNGYDPEEALTKINKLLDLS